MNLWVILAIFTASIFTLLIFLIDLDFIYNVLPDEHDFMREVMEKAIKDDAQKMPP